ncbi:hypothetical protein MHU86_9728 [Fragilaria crotonensis]|nr:hypothetical protein MHU86_9728 [Fragilaria crotonensis]
MSIKSTTSQVDGKITLLNTEGNEPNHEDNLQVNQCVGASERTALDSQEEANRASVRASMSADVQAIKDRARKARASLSKSVGAVAVRGEGDSLVEDMRPIAAITSTIPVPVEVTTFPTNNGRDASDMLMFRDSNTSLGAYDAWHADPRGRTSASSPGFAAVQETSPLSFFSQGHHVRHPSDNSTHSVLSSGSGDVEAMRERARQVAALALPGMGVIRDSFDDEMLERSSLQSTGQRNHVRHSSYDSSQRTLSMASCDIQAIKDRARRGRGSITQPGVVMHRDNEPVDLVNNTELPNSGQERNPRPSGSSVYSDASSLDYTHGDRTSVYSGSMLEHSPTVSAYENARRGSSTSSPLSPVGSGSGETQAMKERARRSRNSIVYPGATVFREGNGPHDDGQSVVGATAIAGLNAEANSNGTSHAQWVASNGDVKSEGTAARPNDNWVNPFMETERPNSGRVAPTSNRDVDALGELRRQPGSALYSPDSAMVRVVPIHQRSVRDLEQDEEKIAVLPKINRKVCFVGASILVLVVVVALGIGLGVALSNNAAADNSDSTSGASVAACVAAADDAGQSDRFLQLSDMLGVSEPDTARRSAICWLADSDGAQIDSTDSTVVEQRFALAAFYYSTMPEGGDHVLTTWLGDSSECEWQGITCKNEEVVNVGLSDIGLVGSIPPEVSFLSGLSQLLVDGNRLTGSLPDELYRLKSLSILNLERNSLEGTLSRRVRNLTMLEILSLGANERMTGVLPDELFGLTGLEGLYILGNNFVGSIPSSIGRMANLRVLAADFNSFNGTLPTEIGLCTSLEELGLSSSDISSTIPTEIGLLRNLTALSLGDKLQGTIPTELGNCANMAQLVLQTNLGLDGTIPSELGKLSKLEKLQLHYTMLTGAMPDEICSLRAVKLDVLDSDCIGGVRVECAVPDCCTECF